MSSKVLVFLAVTLVSIGAAVAIAGIPHSRSAELRDVTTATTVNASTNSDAPLVTDAPPATTGTTISTTAPGATMTPAISTTEAPTTTAATSTTLPPVDRSELSIVVANGASVPGVAGETADRLLEIGYNAVRTLDGTETFERSTVFAAPGLQSEAEQLAIDVGIDTTLVFPISAAPELFGSYEEPLLVYLGADVDLL